MPNNIFNTKFNMGYHNFMIAKKRKRCQKDQPYHKWGSKIQNIYFRLKFTSTIYTSMVILFSYGGKIQSR